VQPLTNRPAYRERRSRRLSQLAFDESLADTRQARTLDVSDEPIRLRVSFVPMTTEERRQAVSALAELLRPYVVSIAARGRTRSRAA
jgi:hypothetical protein